MNQVLNGFIGKAYRIRIQGNIDQKLYIYLQLEQTLSLLDFRNHGHLNQPLSSSPSTHKEVPSFKPKASQICLNFTATDLSYFSLS